MYISYPLRVYYRVCVCVFICVCLCDVCMCVCAGRFGLSCTIDGNRKLTVQCRGIGGVINGSEVACVYDSGPMQEKC